MRPLDSASQVSRDSAPLVSIVVLSWNTLAETAECLAAIRRLRYLRKQIIVVDNGSLDGSKEYLRAQADLLLIDLPVNRGFAGGQIAALPAIRGDYVALVNSDAIVGPDWLQRVVDVAESDCRIGAVGGRCYVWNEVSHAYESSSAFYSYQIVDPIRGYTRTLMSGAETCEVDSISGAAVLLRMMAVREAGYFDERFFAYFEETDLFARMTRLGYRIVYEPQAHAWHKIGKSTDGDPYFTLYYMHRNRFLFAMRNFDDLFALAFSIFYIFDGIRASVRYLRHGTLDDRARIASLRWNVGAIGRTLSDRRLVQRLGGQYSRRVLERVRPRDVSIVIPCFNHAEFVGEAIESAISQTHRVREVIVVDDGSTDGSSEVLQRYRDRVRVISKQNEGVVAAKNDGLALVATTWTIFLDADDVLPPEYVQVLTSRAVRGRLDVVYCDFEYFGARAEYVKAGPFRISRLLSGNFIHNSALIATDRLHEIGGFKQEMAIGYEDWELYLALAEHRARFGYEEGTALRYRSHARDTSRNQLTLEAALNLHDVVRGLHPALFGTRWRRLLGWSEAKLVRVPHIARRLLAEPSLFPEALACLPTALLRARNERPQLGFYAIWKGELHRRRESCEQADA